MSGDPAAELHDTKTGVKVVLCGLWISMLFVFAYVDMRTRRRLTPTGAGQPPSS